MEVSFFQHLFARLSGRTRLLDLSFMGSSEPKTIESMCHALVTGKGEASRVILARQLLDRYDEIEDNEKSTFFTALANHFLPDKESIKRAAQEYIDNPSPQTLKKLSSALESRFQELLRRLNMAPGGTSALVRMRADLLARLSEQDCFRELDDDFVALFTSWFNRGFLVLSEISWSSPASILEKIIQYEAVHAIQGWDDLRRRLNPADRRCFAFFHPALAEEPLIFVQVALEREIPASIDALLRHDGGSRPAGPPDPSVAVFYSISNCQAGLKGISFGSFLIKQVVEDLKRDIPSLRAFVTLSPAPGFTEWLSAALSGGTLAYLSEAQQGLIASALEHGLPASEEEAALLGEAIGAAAAHYFLLAKDKFGRPVDPVARFHLGNGARLHRLNWLADTSENGINQSLSLMVNYSYDLKDIERNHEAYINHGTIAASKQVRSALLAPEKSRDLVPLAE